MRNYAEYIPQKLLTQSGVATLLCTGTLFLLHAPQNDISLQTALGMLPIAAHNTPHCPHFISKGLPYVFLLETAIGLGCFLSGIPIF